MMVVASRSSGSRTTRRQLMAMAAVSPLVAAARRRPRILVRSSWQTVNIGDIAHTPGLLRLLERYLPDTDVWLWPSNVDNGVPG